MTDSEILAELGSRMRQRRLDKNMSLDTMATKSGLNKKTLAKLEAGEDIRISSFIKQFRALGMLGGLDVAVPDTLPTMNAFKAPLQLRQRASRPRTRKEST
ncbi:MAG: helix-turn-helix domain-containing protein [bacterium]|nr:helix-turn-helix domain-containing protein [bacterium]